MDTTTALRFVDFYSRAFVLVKPGEIVTVIPGKRLWMHKQVDAIHVVVEISVGKQGGLKERLMTFDLSRPITADRLRAICVRTSRDFLIVPLLDIRSKINSGRLLPEAMTEAMQDVAARIDAGDAKLLGEIRALEYNT